MGNRSSSHDEMTKSLIPAHHPTPEHNPHRPHVAISIAPTGPVIVDTPPAMPVYATLNQNSLARNTPARNIPARTTLTLATSCNSAL